jgi:hypothetical protein
MAPVLALLLLCGMGIGAAEPSLAEQRSYVVSTTNRRALQQETRLFVAPESAIYNSCPAGAVHVTSVEECQLAAKELGKRWYSGSVGSWGNHMPGCFEGHCGGAKFPCGTGNGNMHFNKAGKFSGKERGLAVCASSSPAGNGPGGTVMPGAEWTLIANELAGAPGSDKLRNLDYTAGKQQYSL